MGHPRTSVTDDDIRFIDLFERGGAALVKQELGCTERNVYSRRNRLQVRLGRPIDAPGLGPRKNLAWEPSPIPGMLEMDIDNGWVVIGSDAHYWLGNPSTAHRGLVKFCKDLKPKLVVNNGDALDFGSISRHPPMNWEERPTVKQEIELTQERLGEIESAAGKARKIWNLGNHDARYEVRLATQAPEFAKVKGVHLHDHFPFWENAWSVRINGNVVITHRYKGGLHATHNNTVNAGVSMVTGHLHSLKATPYTDYTGTRWGVDCGTMADIYGPQFEYLESNPRNWRSGFVVLEFWKGKLRQPSLGMVIEEGLIDFPGQKVIHV